MSKVLLKRESGIAWLIINRPDKRNAIDYDVMDQFDRVLTEIENSDEDKVLVITGEGTKAFCSGGDLASFHQLYTKESAQDMLSRMGEILYRLFFFPKPTVAYINGTAVGGGCEIATACDFRVARTGAKMGFVQGTLGITTGWGGATMLYERLPHQVAAQLLMTCRMFTADEGLQIGFISHVLEEGVQREGLKEWLTSFTNQSTSVLMAYKKKYVNKLNKKDIKEQFLTEIDDCSTLWASEEHHQAVARFLDQS